MFLSKALSSVNSVKSFLLNKKLIALFVFMSLSVNGFVPSAAEVSRYSFVMLAAKVAQSTAMQIFKKCDASLASIAEEFYADIFTMLKGTPLSEKSQEFGGANKGSAPAQKSGGGDGIKQLIYNDGIKVLKDESGYCFASNKLLLCVKNYGYLKNIVFLLSLIAMIFLIFIAVIMRRKRFAAEDIINTNIIGKGNLGLVI